MNAIAIDDEPMALEVIKALCDKNADVHLEKVFTHPTKALKYLQEFPTDLIFCDIQMSSMTGLSLVKSLKQNTMVIFTTAFTEYGAVSYELNAIDYLLKPINQQRFAKAVSKARDYFDYNNKIEQSVRQYIFIRAEFSLVKISIEDIIYIEGLADYLKIYIENRKTVVTRMTMKSMMEKLPVSEFIRVHRSYILPFHKIESLRKSVVSIGDKEFPIGRTYAEEFLNRFKL